MPEYIESEVRKIRESPEERTVTVLLGVSGNRDKLADRVQELGGDIDARIGRATLRAEVPEKSIDTLCELEWTKSVELEKEDVTTYASGGETGN